MGKAQSGWRNANGGGSKPAGTQNLSEVLVEGNNTGQTSILIEPFNTGTSEGSNITFLDSGSSPAALLYINQADSSLLMNTPKFQGRLGLDGFQWIGSNDFLGEATDYGMKVTFSENVIKMGASNRSSAPNVEYNISCGYNSDFNTKDVSVGNVIISSRNSFVKTSSFNSAIIGGLNNTIPTLLTNVVMLGCSDVVASESDTVYASRLVLSSYIKPDTGTEIDFTRPKVFGTFSSPETGNITNDLTGAKAGVIQKIYHNHSTAPTVPASWVLMGNSAYVTGEINIIYAEWSEGTRVEYWIVQEN